MIGDRGGKTKSKTTLTPSRIAVIPSTAAITPYTTALPTIPCLAASLAAIAFFAIDTTLVPTEIAPPIKDPKRLVCFSNFTPAVPAFFKMFFSTLFPTNFTTFCIPLARPKLPCATRSRPFLIISLYSPSEMWPSDLNSRAFFIISLPAAVSTPPWAISKAVLNAVANLT